MFDFILAEVQKKVREEARDLMKQVPRQIILDMDSNKIRFPREFLPEAGRRNLSRCRYPLKWDGRDIDWATACMIIEGIGTLGYAFGWTFGVDAS